MRARSAQTPEGIDKERVANLRPLEVISNANGTCNRMPTAF